MKNQKLAWLTIVFTCLATFSSLAHAQTTGSISGTVMDTTGAVISGATVTITQNSTNLSRVLKTDTVGLYVANLMPIGTYEITVTDAGFQNAAKRGVVLEAAGSIQVNFNLAPASAQISISVQANPVELQTTNPSLGQVVSSQQVANLPLNGRDFMGLATLTPGTAATNGRSGSETDIRGNTWVSVAGSRENQTDFLYDGVSNNELTDGGIGILPSIDAIAEFKVLTSNYSVEYGTRTGPTVLLTSKSGTNQFHGTLFEFLRNKVLNSSSYFSPVKPAYIQNQFGGSVGGPVIKNKLFFFFDYQGTRIGEGSPAITQVPTVLEREGIFTESFPGAPEQPIFDPSSGTLNRTQFHDNTIPPADISLIAQAMLNEFPLPNVPGVLLGDYVSVPVTTLDDNQFDFRLDYTLSSSDQVFARFSRDQASSYVPDGLPGLGSAPGGYDSNQTLSNHPRNLAISETHIFSSTKVNQLTAGYDRVFDHIKSFGDGTNWSDKFGIPNANLGTYLSSGLVNTQFSNGYWGLGDRGFSPIQDGTNIFQYTDNFTWVSGQHSFLIGMDTRFFQLNELGDNMPMGQMTFDTLFTAGLSNGVFQPNTGNPVASFLLGLPDSGSHDYAYTGETSGRRWKMFRPYFQDNWKAGKNLTFQLGLAYNYTTPIVEAINRQSNFDFDTGKLLVAGVNSGASAGVQPYYLDFEPRLGVSYSPTSDTVLRLGYMILHNAGWNSGAQGLDLNPPFAGTYAFQSDNITPTVTLAGGFPVPTPPDVNNLSGNIFSMNTNYRPGMVQQFNLSVQNRLPADTLLTVGYAGMRATHLPTASWNLNTAPPNLGTNPANLRPYPQFVEVLGFRDRGLGRYDSLQVKVQRNKGGLFLLASYTYSKGFDNGTADNVGGGLGTPYYPLTPYPKADKGLSITNLTNNFSASVLYQLPFGRGRTFGSKVGGITQGLIGGWQINLISHMTSGFPVGIETGTNTSGTFLTIAGTPVNNRPNQVCNPGLSHRTVTEFFNTACFVDPDPGVLGDATRTPVSGPNFINFDGSLFKTIPLHEAAHLEFRTEVFNIANHPQFDLPGSATDSAGFAQITDTINNPRLIQFALKLIF